MRGQTPNIISYQDVDPAGRTISMEAVDIEAKTLGKIFDQLGGMAQPHIEASEGGLALIDPPEHMAFHTRAEPIATDTIEPIASAADKRNPAIQIAVDGALWRAPHVLPSIYETLREGGNVGICFSHNVIQDVPLGFGALLTQFGNYEKHRQSEGDPALDMVRGMLVGQILKRVGIVIDPKNPTPADYIMTMLADHLWSSVTTGQSSHGLRRAVPDATRANNEAVKDSVGTVQDEGRLLLAGSISGSTMTRSEDDPEVFIMNGPKDGSMQMAMHESMKWLFIALLIEPGGVRAEFSGASEGLRPGELRTLGSTEEVNAALTGLTDTATNITSIEGRQYVHVPQKGHRIGGGRRG